MMERPVFVYGYNLIGVDLEGVRNVDLQAEDISAVHIRENVVCVYLTSQGELKIKGENIEDPRVSATNDEPVGEPEDTPNAV